MVGDDRVRYFRPARIDLDHPEAGRIRLEMFQLRVAEHPDLLLVVQVPMRGEDLRRVTALTGRP